MRDAFRIATLVAVHLDDFKRFTELFPSAVPWVDRKWWNVTVAKGQTTDFSLRDQGVKRRFTNDS